MRRIEWIVLHCSATRCNREVGPLEIRRMHRERGYVDWGYHYYVRRDGLVCPMRMLEQVGAHVKGFNRYSIGICYEGGLDPEGMPTDTRTAEQRVALRGLVRGLKERFEEARVVGHRDLSPDRNGNGRVEPGEWLKCCPCFDVATEL